MTEDEYRLRMDGLNDIAKDLCSSEGTYKLFSNLLKTALSVDVEITKAKLRISYLESRIKELETTVRKLADAGNERGQ